MNKKISFIMILSLISYLGCKAQINIVSRDSSEYDYKNAQTIDENSDGAMIDSLMVAIDDYVQECFKIEIGFNGYESISEETYYYDSLCILKCYICSWNMEGTSGVEYYWFDNGILSAVYKEFQGQEELHEITIITNTSDYEKYKNCQLNMHQKLNDLHNLITQNIENIVEYDDIIDFNLEEIKNYGFDFVEKTEIIMDKILYQKFFK